MHTTPHALHMCCQATRATNINFAAGSARRRTCKALLILQLHCQVQRGGSIKVTQVGVGTWQQQSSTEDSRVTHHQKVVVLFSDRHQG